MAPYATTRGRRTKKKRQINILSKLEEPSIQSSSSIYSATSSEDPCLIGKKSNNEDGSADVSGCSTPKAQRFRIPEILSCPPAPKKRRSAAENCSIRRSPIAFYAPPDIELFFLVALRNISA